MKPRKSFLTSFSNQKGGTSLFNWMIAAIAIFILYSCNSEKDKKDDNTTKGEDKKEDTPANTTMAWNGNFPYLALPKKTADSLFNSPVKSKKIVFTFQFDNANAAPSLVAYGIKKKAFLAAVPQYKLLKSSFSRNLSGELYLGDLELTDNQYLSLKNDPAYGTSDYLIFEPDFSTTYPKSVKYKVGWGAFAFTKEFKFLGTTEDLKPSPPAPPADPD